ncbi:aldo/keto reductase [Ruminococcaceae bacterium OttesenSCG-928-I18]|nr:aldo/keto reductase [Ruminococcaceae bacterium OttesenSCG-928-I18]
MEYRKLGKTGMEAGVIGLGCEHLDGKPYEVVEQVIDTVLRQGMNLMDIFMPGNEVQSNIGKALGSRRKEVMIQGHIGSVDLKGQYDVSRDLEVCKRYFERLLTNLKTDYIDLGMLFYVDQDSTVDLLFKNGIIDYVQGLKSQGVVRAIGMSSHNPIVAKRMLETGVVEHLMFSINPAFDMTAGDDDVLQHLDGEDFSAYRPGEMDPDRAALYRLCAQREIGISVMKTLASGKLLKAEHSPFQRALSVGQCIHYALTRPAVASVLIGAESPAQVMEAVGYLTLGEEEKDYSSIINNFKGDFEGSCVYCNHCLPCPAEIDIAAVHRCLDVAKLDPGQVPVYIGAQYDALSAHAGDCIACGNCEKKCPFSVPVIKNMEQAKTLLGK